MNLKDGAVDVDAVIVQVREHQVDSWQVDLKPSSQVPLKPVPIDPPDPDVVGELHRCVLADDSKTVADEVVGL